jgi:hypothetical protein
MLENQGGCVNSSQNVYGVSNLQIVNAKILSMIPASYLIATVYPMAKKGADSIKGYCSQRGINCERSFDLLLEV